jgi:hypothetical protein
MVAVCLQDDPRSLRHGVPAVLLYGGVDLEDEVWPCHDTVLARL